MLNKQSLLLTAVAGLACLAPGAAGGEKADKIEMQAKRAVRQLGKALWAKDIDGVMKLVDVPWYDNLGKSRLIRDRAALKPELEKLFPDAKAPAKVVFAIKEIHTYAEVLKKYGSEIDKEDRQLLDQVLKQNDFILDVEVKTPEGEKLTRTLFMVSIQGGRARVVGMREPLERVAKGVRPPENSKGSDPFFNTLLGPSSPPGDGTWQSSSFTR
jgi:hypothetical protein